jgi:hypothetical protein
MQPASLRAASARSAKAWIPMLQGVMVLWALAMPTMGLPKSSSRKPTALSMARLGERCTPWVTTWLRSGEGGLAIMEQSGTTSPRWDK